MIDKLLSTWGMLRKILTTILFTNLLSAKPIMKVIQTAYLEFSLSPERDEPSVVFDDYDRTFQFDKTTYRIHKHTLIVTLHVRTRKSGG